MKEGAVALIDCLGFKGIWKRADPDSVLKGFSEVRDAALTALDQGMFQIQREIGLRIRMSFLSDTVAIGVDTEPQIALADFEKGRMLDVAMLTAQRAATHFLRMSTPLAVRGCVVFDKFDFNDTFLIGPAVDMAAEMHEKADGAFVWIPPQFDHFIAAFRSYTQEVMREKSEKFDSLMLLSAVGRTFDGDAGVTAREQFENEQGEGFKERVREMLREAQDFTHYPLMRYPVPMKGGSTLDCWTADLCSHFRDRREWWNRTAAAMQSNDNGVAVKLQNTQRFLRQCMERHDSFQAKWKALVQKTLLSPIPPRV